MHEVSRAREGQTPNMSSNFRATPSPQVLVTRLPGTRYGLEGDPYGPFYLANVADSSEFSRAMDSHTLPVGNQSAYTIPKVHPLPRFSSLNPNSKIGESSNAGQTNSRPTLFETLGITELVQ